MQKLRNEWDNSLHDTQQCRRSPQHGRDHNDNLTLRETTARETPHKSHIDPLQNQQAATATVCVFAGRFSPVIFWKMVEVFAIGTVHVYHGTY